MPQRNHPRAFGYDDFNPTTNNQYRIVYGAAFRHTTNRGAGQVNYLRSDDVRYDPKYEGQRSHRVNARNEEEGIDFRVEMASSSHHRHLSSLSGHQSHIDSPRSSNQQIPDHDEPRSGHPSGSRPHPQIVDTSTDEYVIPRKTPYVQPVASETHPNPLPPPDAASSLVARNHSGSPGILNLPTSDRSSSVSDAVDEFDNPAIKGSKSVLPKIAHTSKVENSLTNECSVSHNEDVFERISSPPGVAPGVSPFRRPPSPVLIDFLTSEPKETTPSSTEIPANNSDVCDPWDSVLTGHQVSSVRGDHNICTARTGTPPMPNTRRSDPTSDFFDPQPSRGGWCSSCRCENGCELRCHTRTSEDSERLQRKEAELLKKIDDLTFYNKMIEACRMKHVINVTRECWPEYMTFCSNVHRLAEMRGKNRKHVKEVEEFGYYRLYGERHYNPGKEEMMRIKVATWMAKNSGFLHTKKKKNQDLHINRVVSFPIPEGQLIDF